MIYDAPHPAVLYRNETGELVRVAVAGARLTYDEVVASEAIKTVPLEECVGTALVVETDSGNSIGRVDQPACPGWTLTIRPDRSLSYSQD